MDGWVGRGGGGLLEIYNTMFSHSHALSRTSRTTIISLRCLVATSRSRVARASLRLRFSAAALFHKIEKNSAK